MKISIRRSDGGVSVMNLAEGLTLADVPAEIARWEAGNGNGWTSTGWRVVQSSDLPSDRSDRDAWQDDGVTIAVNAPRKTALLDAKHERQVDQLQSDALKALATALFHVLNDVRVLKGQAPISAAQYRTYLKGLL